MRYRSLLASALLLNGCVSPRPPAADVLVGPGPCDDYILNDEKGRVARGCVGVLLVEAAATRQAGDPGEFLVEGRALVAGSLTPLPGANVVVVGQERHTASGEGGRFRLGELGLEDRLAVSYVGFWPDTLAVGLLPGPRVLEGPRTRE